MITIEMELPVVLYGPAARDGEVTILKFKATGDAALVEKERIEFLQFVERSYRLK